MATAKKAARPAPRRRTVTKAAPARPAAKRAARPAAKAAAKPVAKAAAKPAKVAKPRKPKLVRDSFTIPKPEYAVLQALKDRAAVAGKAAKKSELVRAGIQALAAMTDGAFLNAISSVPAAKAKRPAKG